MALPLSTLVHLASALVAAQEPATEKQEIIRAAVSEAFDQCLEDPYPGPDGDEASLMRDIIPLMIRLGTRDRWRAFRKNAGEAMLEKILGRHAFVRLSEIRQALEDVSSDRILDAIEYGELSSNRAIAEDLSLHVIRTRNEAALIALLRRGHLSLPRTHAETILRSIGQAGERFQVILVLGADPRCSLHLLSTNRRSPFSEDFRPWLSALFWSPEVSDDDLLPLLGISGTVVTSHARLSMEKWARDNIPGLAGDILDLRDAESRKTSS